MNASDKLTKLSGYHWGILLAPKDVPLFTSEDKDSIRWDVTNGIIQPTIGDFVERPSTSI